MARISMCWRICRWPRAGPNCVICWQGRLSGCWLARFSIFYPPSDLEFCLHFHHLHPPLLSYSRPQKERPIATEISISSFVYATIRHHHRNKHWIRIHYRSFVVMLWYVMWWKTRVSFLSINYKHSRWFKEISFSRSMMSSFVSDK